MTGLIAGSLLSLVGAALALAAGWMSANEVLVWLSILASGVTGLLLALAYSRSKQQAVAAMRRAARRNPPQQTAGFSTQPAPAETAAVRRRTAVPKSAPAGPGVRRGVPPGGPQQSVSPTDGEVVAVGDRRTYHRPDCGRAKVRGAEPMSKAAARRRSYQPCAVCKP